MIIKYHPPVLKSASFQGSEGEVFGVVDFWVRLFSPAEPVNTVVAREAKKKAIRRSSVPTFLGWQDTGHEVRCQS